MSVVNKMLRDLESREKIQTFAPVSANYVPPKTSKSLWFSVVCFGLVSGLVASYSLYLVGQTPTSGPIKQIPGSNQVQAGDQYAAQNETNQNLPNDIPKNKQSDSQASAYIPSALEQQSQALVSSANSSVNFSNLKPAILKTKVMPSMTKSFTVSPSYGAKSKLSSLRAEAHMASQQNDEAKVVQFLREILVIEPKEIKTRKQLAALLFSKNQLNEAKVVLTEGIEQTPSDSSLRLMLSRIYYRLGDLKNAYTVLEKHPYSALANDELVSFRAALAEKTGNYYFAEQDYLLLLQRNPNDAKWWLGLGVSQDKQKLNIEAINSYQQAQALNQLPQKVDSFVAQRIHLLAGRS